MKKITLCLLVMIGCIEVNAQYDHLNISLLGQFNDLSVTPEPTYGIRYQGCWGWVDSTNGREYGIIGSTAGTYIIEVTDPANPVQRDYIPGRRNNRIWHEYKTYNNYLYITSDGGGNTLQIADLSYLPDSVHVLYDSSGVFDSGHAQYMDGSHWYVSSVSSAGGNSSSMNVYSVANGFMPVLLRRLDADYAAISSVHDMFVIHDTVFASCGYDGLFVFYYDSIANEFNHLGDLTTYPDAGYNHSSFISQDHSTLYMTDEVPAGMAVKVVDVTDLQVIPVPDTFSTHANATPHNPYVIGDLLVLAYYQDGIYTYNISDPSNPVNTGYFDTHPQNTGGLYPNPAYQGAWGAYTDLPSGVLLASDMQLGLFVLDITQATGFNHDPVSDDALIIYPNPVTSLINIKFSNEHQNYSRVELSDMTGKIIAVSENNIGEISLDVRNVEQGIYILHVLNGKKSTTRKISILR